MSGTTTASVVWFVVFKVMMRKNNIKKTTTKTFKGNRKFLAKELIHETISTLQSSHQIVHVYTAVLKAFNM